MSPESSRAPEVQAVQRKGIYNGLPVYRINERYSGMQAIVVGASGMSGQSMIDVLARDHHRWKKVYALSRRPPQLSSGPSNVEHVSIDLLNEPDELGATLKQRGVQA